MDQNFQRTQSQRQNIYKKTRIQPAPMQKQLARKAFKQQIQILEANRQE